MKCHVCLREREETYPLETYNNTRDLYVCRECIAETDSLVQYNEENQTFFLGGYNNVQYGPGLTARIPFWRQEFYNMNNCSDTILDPEYNYLSYRSDTEEERYYTCSICDDNLLTRRLCYDGEDYLPVCPDCDTGEQSMVNPNENLHPHADPQTESISDRENHREATLFPIRIATSLDGTRAIQTRENTRNAVRRGEAIYDLGLDCFIASSLPGDTLICKGDILAKTISLSRPSIRVSQEEYCGFRVVDPQSWQAPTTREPQELSKRDDVESEYLCQNCKGVSNKMLPVYTDDKIYLHCQKCAMDKDLVLQERTSGRLYLKSETSFVEGQKGIRRVIASRTDFDSDGHLCVPKRVQEDSALLEDRRCEECHSIKNLKRLRRTQGREPGWCGRCIRRGEESGQVMDINGIHHLVEENEQVFRVATQSTVDLVLLPKDNDVVSDDCLICKKEGCVHYKDMSMKGKYCKTHYQLAKPKPQEPETRIDSYHNHRTEPYHFLHTENEYLNNVQTYFGIELEVEFDRDVQKQEVARKALSAGKGLFYAENDGSLMNGFELISRPMTLGYLSLKKTQETIKSMLDYLKRESATTEKNTAGMHIHISRPKDLPIKEEYQKNLFWIVETLNLPILKIAEREPTSYCESVLRKISRRSELRELKQAYVDKNIDWWDYGRHTNINISGHRGKTHELRIFNTTLSYDHMMAAVELFNAISEAAKDLDNFDKLTFGKLVKKYGGKYLKKEAEEKELQQYYKLKIPKEVRIK